MRGRKGGEEDEENVRYLLFYFCVSAPLLTQDDGVDSVSVSLSSTEDLSQIKDLLAYACAKICT